MAKDLKSTGKSEDSNQKPQESDLKPLESDHEPQESDPTSQKSQHSGLRVVHITFFVAAFAIFAGCYLKPSVFSNSATDGRTNIKPVANSSKDVPISGPDLKLAQRKLSELNEYEDSLDHSAEVSNWDIYRPAGDHKLKSQFALYDQKHFEDAKREFETAVDLKPESLWALYGAAIASEKVAELENNSTSLEDAVEFYDLMCSLDIEISNMSVQERDAELAGCRRLANLFYYAGWSTQAHEVLAALSERYPSEKSVHHDLGVLLILIGEHNEAKKIFENLVTVDPTDGFAEAYLGYLVKVFDGKLEEAIKHLSNGIRSGKPGMKDGRFYHHLGDALSRSNRREEANKWYEEGHRYGLFLSPIQRSLYNVANLTAKPWWSVSETKHETEFKMLEEHWQEIAKEALNNLDKNTSMYNIEKELPSEFGDLSQFTLFNRGQKVEAHCKSAPITCQLIEKFPDAVGCRRGQVKFSLMKPGTYVWPHTGPTNTRLRAHLGLKVPAEKEANLKVVKQFRPWVEGKVFVFDDSFEHEAWHNGKEDRLILIVDFWHPDLSDEQKAKLRTI